MFNVKVEDFIDVKVNYSSFAINDMIHICKRHRNTKREYLFVNKYQGKHNPVPAETAFKMFDELYSQVENNFRDTGKKILVVGFAETATAIAQRISYNGMKSKSINIVYHLQTTRENFITNIKNISFEETHSHAVAQKLFYRNDVPEYNEVLFVEDEITTGNTIINFINQFRKINPAAHYTVASILNWQNEENENKYKELGIDTLYLVKGHIKENLPSLPVPENNLEGYSLSNPDEMPYVFESIYNPRLGLSAVEFNNLLDNTMKLYSFYTDKYKGRKVMVIGTEEDMYVPMLVAERIGPSATVRATTRSPIEVYDDEGYLIRNGIKIPSAYDVNRETYLYNIDTDCEAIIIVGEVCNDDFKNILTEKLHKMGFNKEIEFI